MSLLRTARTTIAAEMLLLALVACTSSAPEPTASSPPAPATPNAAPTDHITPLIPQVMSTPRWFTGADGQAHLVYELQLTNAFPVPATVTDVRTKDAGSGATVQDLGGDLLLAATGLLGAAYANQTTTIPAASVGVVWMDVPFANPSRIPAKIDHQITVSVPPGLPVASTVTYTAAEAEVDHRPPVVLGPPLAGDNWIALGSCCDGPHRRALQPVNGKLQGSQRFAIDWNGMDSSNHMTEGDPKENASWIFYGAPVLAVADAKVVTVVDDQPDQTPDNPQPVDFAHADGNQVVLALGDGRYAFYAHLVPGSVTVAVGDTVKEGQVIGKLGNSGNTTGPHLHFHVADGISPFDADGLPYVFTSFTLRGRTPALDQVQSFISAGTAIPVDTTISGARKDAFPQSLDVVDFPPLR